MSRALAFTFFLTAAFAWPLPFLDRAGTAALGFAFLALAVGRVGGRTRPSLFQPRLRPGLESLEDIEPTVRDLSARVAAYTDGGRA